MKYRLLAIDLDGTLFDSSGNVSDANRAAITQAKDAGVLVTLCTGRGLTESRSAIDAIEHDGPVILATGALVSDPTTGQTLHRAVIEPGLAAEIVDHLRPTPHAVLILPDPGPQQHDYIVVNPGRLTDNTRWWFEMISANVRETDEASDADLHHALRVGLVGRGSEMPALEASIEERFGNRVVVHHFMAVKREEGEDVYVLEVFASGVNKWSGIEWLAAEHGIDRSEVATIGDGINDVAMIREAPCGIAMANAHGPLLDLADRVTLSNDEDGVAHAIERMLAGHW